MHYQGYQSNNKQPAGPLILHISETYFLKFFHTVRGGSPLPHPPLLVRYACPGARFSRILRPPHFQSCSKAYGTSLVELSYYAILALDQQNLLEIFKLKIKFLEAA